MVVTLSKAEKARIKDLQHRLAQVDPTNDADKPAFFALLKSFIVKAENTYLTVYGDRSTPAQIKRGEVLGFRTIGQGFNMEAAGAREEWANAFKHNPAMASQETFTAVLKGERSLTHDQVATLTNHSLQIRIDAVEKIYGKIIEKFPPEHRGPIEATLVKAYYNSPRAVGQKSDVYQHLREHVQIYAETGKNESFLAAVAAMRTRGDHAHPKIREGIQNVAALEAALMNVPFEVKPKDLEPFAMKQEIGPLLYRRYMAEALGEQPNSNEFQRLGVLMHQFDKKAASLGVDETSATSVLTALDQRVRVVVKGDIEKQLSAMNVATEHAALIKAYATAINLQPGDANALARAQADIHAVQAAYRKAGKAEGIPEPILEMGLANAQKTALNLVHPEIAIDTNELKGAAVFRGLGLPIGLDPANVNSDYSHGLPGKLASTMPSPAAHKRGSSPS